MNGAATLSQGSLPAALMRALIEEHGPIERFLATFVEMQARLGGARCGALLRIVDGQGDRVDVVAVWPVLDENGPEPKWLAEAARMAVGFTGGETGRWVELSAGRAYVCRLPMSPGGRLIGAYVAPEHGEMLTSLIEATAPLLMLRQTVDQQRAPVDNSDRLRRALSVVAAVNEQSSFRGAALGVVNELAHCWKCERVALGLLKGRFIKLAALSHTEQIVRSSSGITAIEAAMEECLDQDTEIIAAGSHAPEGSTYIARQSIAYATRDGLAWVCSFPLRIEGAPLGVLTVQRRVDAPLDDDELAGVRLACELVTPRLFDLHTRDQWVGARAREVSQRWLSVLVGARHTWAKLIAIILLGAIVFSLVTPGMYRATAPCAVRSSGHRVIAAPLQGTLGQIDVNNGDLVEAGDVLGKIETRQIELQLSEATARREIALGRAAIARREGKTAEAQIAQAEAQEASARVNLLTSRIDSALLRAPLSGVVLDAPEDERSGALIQLGEPLFEIAPSGALRVDILIPADRIAEIPPEARGTIALESKPEKKIGFVIEWTSPAAEIIENRSVFKARARLEDSPTWLRSGLEGVAKIDIAPHSLAWIWTRRLSNWLRLKLWI